MKLDASGHNALREEVAAEVFGAHFPYDPRPAPGKDHFDEIDMEFGGFADCGGDMHPLKGHFKDMLVNAALDRNLVESIYVKLTESKPFRGFPFDRVEMLSVGGGDFGMVQIPHEIDAVFEEIQSSWLIERVSIEDRFTITKLESELDPPTRPFADADLVRDLDPRIEQIFRRIWPMRHHGSKWKSDWHGMPLAPR